jgi:hypothetical protein
VDLSIVGPPTFVVVTATIRLLWSLWIVFSPRVPSFLAGSNFNPTAAASRAALLLLLLLQRYSTASCSFFSFLSPSS